jgi:hypothetical protein
MEHFTIHIFGYGETQINGKDFSVKVKTNTLTKVQSLVDAVWNLKPADSQAQQNFHAINVFNYKEIRYMTQNGFKVATTPELEILINDLIDELRVAYDNLPQNP